MEIRHEIIKDLWNETPLDWKSFENVLRKYVHEILEAYGDIASEFNDDDYDWIVMDVASDMANYSEDIDNYTTYGVCFEVLLKHSIRFAVIHQLTFKIMDAHKADLWLTYSRDDAVSVVNDADTFGYAFEMTRDLPNDARMIEAARWFILGNLYRAFK